jgi:hypothetical protein
MANDQPQNVPDDKQPDQKMEIIIRSPDTLEQEDKDKIIAKYITPELKCVCCNLPKLALKINEAYLNGFTYQQIIDQYGEQVKDMSDKKLDMGILSEHFTKHFNFKGAAIAEYNRKRGMNSLTLKEQDGMKNIFEVLVTDNINDLEVLQLAMKEQIRRLQELEDIKTRRIKENRVFNLDGLIMKQELITNNIINNILSKLKFWQSAKSQTKTLEQRERFLDFLDKKTADFLGIEIDYIRSDPKLMKAAEKLYLNVIIEHFIKRMKDSMQMSLEINQYQIATFLKEFNRQCGGIEIEISNDFRERLKNLKEVGSDFEKKKDHES